MKLCVPFIVCMLLCFYVNGQSFNEPNFPTNLASLTSTNTKVFAPVLTAEFSKTAVPADSLRATFYNNDYYLQRSRNQQLNGFVLMAGGSLISAIGIRNGLNRGINFKDDTNHGDEYKFEKISCTRLAVTGLVLMAGSIPYFISALRNKNKVGLKLTCQKTSFGASPKACKKVTSLTFGIPIGR